MSEAREERSIGRDALGIVLFGLAAFIGVSVVMSVTRPVDDPAGTTALVHAVVGMVGPLSGFLLSVGLAWLGARIWLAGVAGRVGRDLLATFLCTLGLAVLAGALGEGAGGRLGAATGGALPLVAGVLLGLAAFLTPIWVFWIQPLGVFSWNLGQPEEPRAVGFSDSEGVSAAEAAALLPTPSAKKTQKVGVGEGDSSGEIRPSSIPILPPSPYPPDVRLLGGIPEGTVPLETPHDPRAFKPTAARPPEPAAGPGVGEPDFNAPLEGHSDEAAALSRWTPEGLVDAPEPAGEDLAGAELEAPPRDELTHPQAAPLRAPEPEVQPLARTEPEPAAPIPGEPGGLEESAVQALSDDPPTGPDALRPSWEQPDLFDEEPVDAYGTPVSLVESLRGENQATTARLESPQDEPEEATAEADELEEEEEEELETEEVHAEEEDLEEAEDQTLAEDEEYEEEEDEDEDEEEDAESEEESEELDEESAEQEAEPEASADEDDSPGQEEQLAADVQAASEDEVLTPRPAPEPPAPRKPSKRGAKKAAAASAGHASDLEDLVHRAGCLFLERQRVAVSMLQREFDLDFDQATALLDRLQVEGLIGPYMGGKRRDILLTAEEWNARVGAS